MLVVVLDVYMKPSYTGSVNCVPEFGIYFISGFIWCISLCFTVNAVPFKCSTFLTFIHVFLFVLQPACNIQDFSNVSCAW